MVYLLNNKTIISEAEKIKVFVNLGTGILHYWIPNFNFHLKISLPVML